MVTMDYEPWKVHTNMSNDENAEEIISDNKKNAMQPPTQQMAQVKNEPPDEEQITEDTNEKCNQDRQGDNVYITPEFLRDSLNDDGSGETKSNRKHRKRKKPNYKDDDDDEDDDDDNENDDNTIFDFKDIPSPVRDVSQRLRNRFKLNPSSSHLINGNSTIEDLETFIDYDRAIIYICPACGSEFNAQDIWKRHMNVHHAFNTRKGLNFIQLDRLYHECLECHKRIAMHAMENLLKHKFTHLPFRCTKCRICMRQYKYRQDLMVHLRTMHRVELLTATKDYEAIKKKRSLAIKDIQENAIDIFENSCDGIEVRNELLEPDDDQMPPPYGQNSLSLDESSMSYSSSSSLHQQQQQQSPHRKQYQQTKQNELNHDMDMCEKYMQFICARCGIEYEAKTEWREHIVTKHGYGTRSGLNFKEYPKGNLQVQCKECHRIMPGKMLTTLQIHKFSHLPHKSWLRCKLCFRCFVGLKEICKHLINQHRIGVGQLENYEEEQEELRNDNDDEDDGTEFASLLGESTSPPRDSTVDMYEPDIEYLCPQCGKEFGNKKSWRKHIVIVHRLTDLRVLNFKVINERGVQCLDCDKLITNAYGIQNAQQHRFTHMPFKAYVRCRLCKKTYTDRKGLTKHLKSKHRCRSVQKPPGNTMRTLRSSTSQASPIRPAIESNKKAVEIVHKDGYIYEITYLEDDNNKDNNRIINGNNESVDDEVDNENAADNDDDDDDEDGDDDRLLILDTEPVVNSKYEHNNHNMDRSVHTSTYKDNINVRRSTLPANIRTNDTNDDHIDGGDDSNDNLLIIPTVNQEREHSESYSKPDDCSGIEMNFCYLCPACGEEFRLQIDWRRHINSVHNFDKRHYLSFRQLDKSRFQCTICKVVVGRPKLKGLQDHKFRHLPYKLYIKCLLCCTCYNHKPNMISHLRVRHNIEDRRQIYDLQADDDNDDDSNNSNMNMNKSNNKPLPLPTPTPTTTTTPTKQPITQLVTEKLIASEEKDEFVPSFHNAVDHESIIYHCPQCNIKFDTHLNWRTHIVVVHNLNSREGLNFRQIDAHHFMCLQCYKRVTVTHSKGCIGQLQSHKFRHLPYKSFGCSVCEVEFVRKQMFFRHLNRQTNQCRGLDKAKMTNSKTVPQMTDDNSDEVTAVDIKEKLNNNDNDINEDDHNDGDEDGDVHGDGNGDVDVDADEDETSAKFNAKDAGICSKLVLNLRTFSLVCPKCGIDFNNATKWKEHLLNAHQLNRCEALGFKTLHKNDVAGASADDDNDDEDDDDDDDGVTHECLVCQEQLKTNNLRELQLHSFKHFLIGFYIQCKFCILHYYSIEQFKTHLHQRHRNVVQPHDEYVLMDELQRIEKEFKMCEVQVGEAKDEIRQTQQPQQQQQQQESLKCTTENAETIDAPIIIENIEKTIETIDITEADEETKPKSEQERQENGNVGRICSQVSVIQENYRERDDQQQMKVVVDDNEIDEILNANSVENLDVNDVNDDDDDDDAIKTIVSNLDMDVDINTDDVCISIDDNDDDDIEGIFPNGEIFELSDRDIDCNLLEGDEEYLLG